MDNIIDITFNFKMYEDLLKETNTGFCDGISEVYSQLALLDTLKPCKNMNNMGDAFKSFYDNLIGDDGEEFKKSFDRLYYTIRFDLYNAIKVVNRFSKKLVKVSDLLINMYDARIKYIECDKNQNEIYSNYKLRSEWQDLKNNIKEVERLKLISNEKLVEINEIKQKLSEESNRELGE